ncbi:hypothetical protein D1007_54215 [Hordeum vulgare]|nr:hypothetical protein D1007_54215 [Hordeum vulgare]
MNFSDVRTREEAQVRAPPPRLITIKYRHIPQRRERCLLIVEADEKATTVWGKRYPRDVAIENTFWTHKRAEQTTDRTDMCERKALAEAKCDLGQASTWDETDPQWDEVFLSSAYTTEESEEWFYLVYC